VDEVYSRDRWIIDIDRLMDRYHYCIRSTQELVIWPPGGDVMMIHAIIFCGRLRLDTRTRKRDGKPTQYSSAGSWNAVIADGSARDLKYATVPSLLFLSAVLRICIWIYNIPYRVSCTAYYIQYFGDVHYQSASKIPEKNKEEPLVA
jgi:hypothetical protein